MGLSMSCVLFSRVSGPCAAGCPFCQPVTKLLVTASLLLGLSACATAEAPLAAAATSSPAATGAAEQSALQPVVMASAQEYAVTCGICHLAGGEGIPAAFPPLDARLAAVAQSDAGRDYLVGILYNGLYGQIEVNGSLYNGAMPAIGAQLNESDRAGLLNYVITTFGGDEASANFTAAEVTARIASVGSTSSATLRGSVSALQQ